MFNVKVVDVSTAVIQKYVDTDFIGHDDKVYNLVRMRGVNFNIEIMASQSNVQLHILQAKDDISFRAFKVYLEHEQFVSPCVNRSSVIYTSASHALAAYLCKFVTLQTVNYPIIAPNMKFGDTQKDFEALKIVQESLRLQMHRVELIPPSRNHNVFVFEGETLVIAKLLK